MHCKATPLLPFAAPQEIEKLQAADARTRIAAGELQLLVELPCFPHAVLYQPPPPSLLPPPQVRDAHCTGMQSLSHVCSAVCAVGAGFILTGSSMLSHVRRKSTELAA